MEDGDLPKVLPFLKCCDHCLLVLRQDVHRTLCDEVHLVTVVSFIYDVVAWKEDHAL